MCVYMHVCLHACTCVCMYLCLCKYVCAMWSRLDIEAEGVVC